MPKDADWEWDREPEPPYRSEDERAEREAENCVRLSSRVLDLVEAGDGLLRLTPEAVLDLHRLATDGVLRSAGRWRERFRVIEGTPHVPVKRELVEPLMAEMCEYANRRLADDPFHAAAYLLWRLNWIHPFDDGNGRVSRALADLALGIGTEGETVGAPTIATLIAKFRERYLRGLATADAAWSREDRIDVAALETLLSDAVIDQAASRLDRAGAGNAGPPAS